MNFFHREGPAAQGMARRLATKKSPLEECRKPTWLRHFLWGMVGPAGFEPTDGGVKVLCLTAWRWRIIYPACYATLLCFQRAGNNVNEKFYIPFRAGPSDRSRSCGLMLPKHALFQLSYTRILVLPTRLERARRFRQKILSLRCLPFHHGSLHRRSETANHSFYILVFWRTEEYLSDS